MPTTTYHKRYRITRAHITRALGDVLHVNSAASVWDLYR